MILLETALTVLLVWILASCSLILGGCISACLLRISTAGPKQLVLYRQPHYLRREKSDLYLN